MKNELTQLSSNGSDAYVSFNFDGITDFTDFNRKFEEIMGDRSWETYKPQVSNGIVFTTTRVESVQSIRQNLSNYIKRWFKG